MLFRSDLPFLGLREAMLIPLEAVDAQRFALSSRALLVMRSDDEIPAPRRQTLAQRRRCFTQHVGHTVEEYLCAFEDGVLDALDEHVAVHVVEAEELIAAERRR